MSVNSVDVFRGTMYINYGSTGWAETFDFAPAPLPELVQKMKDLVQYRARMLPPECRVEYARINQKGKIRKTRRVIRAPIAGTYAGTVAPTARPINDPTVALLFALEGENYSQAERFISGVPDAEITNTIWQSGDPSPALLVPAPDTFQASDPPVVEPVWLTALQEYFTLVKKYTVLARKTIIVNPDLTETQSNQLNNIEQFFYRGVKRRQRGRPFGLLAGRVQSR